MLTQSAQHHQTNLFGSDLLLQLDPNDPLLRLAAVIPWQDFDNEFSKHYQKNIGASYRLYQRQECDPYRKNLSGAKSELSRTAFLG